MHTKIIKILICPNCHLNKFSLERFIYSSSRIEEGVVVCLKCRHWFRIENGILDLLPLYLRNKSKYRRFSRKYKLSLKSSQAKKNLRDLRNGKNSQINFFKKEVLNYERQVVNNKYYKALDSVTFESWIAQKLTAKDSVLDLGCGTARQCIPIAKMGIETIGIDISEEMLVLGREKVISNKVDDLVDLIVADAEDAPFVNNHFSACVLYGTLHHVTNPQKVIENASQKLVKGGLIYTSDPNKSPARFIFDLSMILWRLYQEDRGGGDLLTENKLKRWFEEAGIKSKITFSTYLLPHFFNFMSFKQNQRILRSTDRALNKISYLRSWGGLIIAEGLKE